MTRRALSLIELLLAIFILGIGIISIAALFPAGIAQQQRSVDDVTGPIVAENALELLRLRLDDVDFESIFGLVPGSFWYTTETDFPGTRPAFFLEDSEVDTVNGEVGVPAGSISIFPLRPGALSSGDVTDDGSYDLGIDVPWRGFSTGVLPPDPPVIIRAGERAYGAGQYELAAQAFEEAYALLPLPAIAFSTAQAYRLQYFIDKKPARLKRAIEMYRIYVDAVDKGGRRDDATSSLAELEPILARIEAASGAVKAERMAKRATQLMISTQVEGARAAIDDDALAAAPVIKDVEPGEHAVKVTADGYFTVEQKAVAVDGRLVVVELELRAKPALVALRSDSGASVAIDGRPVGSAPFSRPIEVDAGRHFITVIKRGRHGWSREIEVARGERLELDAELDATGQRKLSYWVMGASLVSFGAAGAFGLFANGDDGDASDILALRDERALTPQEVVDYRDAVAARDVNKSRMVGFAIAGGVLATTGVLLYLIDMPRAESRPPARRAPVEPVEEGDPGLPVSVAPIVGPDLAGVGLSATW